MYPDFLMQLAQPDIRLLRQCISLNVQNGSKIENDLSFVVIFLKSDKRAENVTHLCKYAWKDASSVNVALGHEANLRIVPICEDKFDKSQSVAVVLNDITVGEHGNYTDRYSKNVKTAFGHEPKNVTCLVNTAWGETYRHVFTSPLIDTLEGSSCVEQKETDQKTFPAGTRNPEIENLTIPYTARTVPAQPGKRTALPVRLVTLLAVVGLTLIAMLPVTRSLRKHGYCSGGNQAAQLARSRVGSPLSIASLNHWMIGGASGQAVTVNIRYSTAGRDRATGSVTEQASCSGDEHPYSEIPDEYYNKYPNTDTYNKYENTDTYNKYQNTDTLPPATYWEIPDEYFNYYNTHPASLHTAHYENTTGRPLSCPLALQEPLSSGHDDEVRPVSFNASAALPMVNLRCKSYGTASRAAAVPQHYGVGARNAPIPSYGIPASVNRRARGTMSLVGEYGRTQRSSNKIIALYSNPPTATKLPKTVQTSVMLKDAFKHEPVTKVTKSNRNMSSPPTGHLSIARSNEDTWATPGEGRIHRSKTFSIKLTNKTSQTDEARLRRKSL
ncbi:PREDICTED: uncharacterized protein LOC109474484 [Branchiostoma belcheri]|uniref:Uncharacterized protein LOC109474484 n=1 Tax=Branchiostoma belcheri TaxID=7741 RepID=A0A6P4Z8X5_BRABE|nr:PREDICTED: uncharacterized protein LOC109474484 [Branchiostoma belcheri]